LRPVPELAQIIDRFGKEFEAQHPINAYVQRTLRAIRQCRSLALGGHVDQCDTCGHIRISYNSCRNRHCPKCQNTRREEWIENRKQDLLPIPYFHVVFTVPDKLNSVFLFRPAEMYNILFRTVWETIAQFSLTKYRAETGMVAVLHTWGQNLSLHPHLHCIVPGGGIDYTNQWVQVKTSGEGKTFLFPVKNLSVVFRGKFIEALRQQFPQDQSFIRELYRSQWVVYAKEPFAGPGQVVEYLGRYTHKVAISNHPLISTDDMNVRFRYLDYRDSKQKEMTIQGVEFLRRFCQHILPKGFVRIRHYGLLSATRRPVLRQLQLEFGIPLLSKREKKPWKQICIENLNFNPDLCPCCKKGQMVTIELILPGRAPPMDILVKNQNQKMNLFVSL
jgi:hypothetical protein